MYQLTDAIIRKDAKRIRRKYRFRFVLGIALFVFFVMLFLCSAPDSIAVSTSNGGTVHAPGASVLWLVFCIPSLVLSLHGLFGSFRFKKYVVFPRRCQRVVEIGNKYGGATFKIAFEGRAPGTVGVSKATEQQAALYFPGDYAYCVFFGGENSPRLFYSCNQWVYNA